ncbi:peptide ABC transporter permease [Microbacterium sp. NPDC089321]|uniref:peptide ABC transporter permease n=1 Tax=Microbacterium sp. NPDC089321 TaxID=3155183 RepID=UPI00342F78E1
MTIAEHPAGRLFVPGSTAQAAPAAPLAPALPRAVTWSKVDTGFHVASRAGEYVGSVDTTPDGHFVAFDGTSAPIGRYAELSEAKSAVLAWKPERTRIRDRRLSEAVAPIAASAGLVAVATAALGALLGVAPV